MGAFLESASQGTRLVPESMSHKLNPKQPDGAAPLGQGGGASRHLTPKGCSHLPCLEAGLAW